MNDLLEQGRSAMEKSFTSQTIVPIDEKFIDNVYFTLLKWIIDCLEQIEVGNSILCDYDKKSKQFVLKQIKNLSNVNCSNDQEFVYVCDKQRQLMATSVDKAKITINGQTVEDGGDNSVNDVEKLLSNLHL